MDRVCHFHLFQPRVDYSNYAATSWNVDEVLEEVQARTPMAAKSNLNFLKKSVEFDCSSTEVLSKFGIHMDSRNSSQNNTSQVTCFVEQSP